MVVHSSPKGRAWVRFLQPLPIRSRVRSEVVGITPNIWFLIFSKANFCFITMKKILITITAIIISITVWYIAAEKSKIPTFFYPPNLSAKVESDVRKISNLGDDKVILQLYYEKFKKYPKVVGDTPEARRQSLNDTMVKEYATLGFTSPIYLLDTDPKGDYQTDEGQQNAVLKTTLELPKDQDVQGAIRGGNTYGEMVGGTAYGLDCNIPNYCIRPLNAAQ